MFFRHASPSQRQRHLQAVRYVLALLFLFAVVSLCIIDPIVECHDHMDNLRHMGTDSLLTIALLAASAGSMFFLVLRSLRGRTHRLAAIALDRGACHRVVPAWPGGSSYLVHQLPVLRI